MTQYELEAWTKRHAQKGAVFFDRMRPHWADQIDLFRLDLRCANRCPVGQLHGGLYEHGLTQLEISQTQCAAFGFEIPKATPPESQKEAWRRLTNAWRHEVLARLIP